MNNIFKDFNSSLEIYNEKEYERETGEKLDNNIAETEQLSKNVLGTSTENVNVPNTALKDSIDIQFTVEKENKRKHNIITPTQTHTKNTFLNTVQKNEIEKINNEIQRIANSNIQFPYKKTRLLTNAELQLYHFMINNLENVNRVSIFPKVRLADIIEVDSKITFDKRPLYKIASKHVDFLVCDSTTLDIICVVELDDYTHEQPENKERDIFVMQALKECGIEVARMRFKIATIEKKDLEYLESLIYNYFAPPCPMCGLEMKMQTNRRTGNKFYACIDNIHCRHTVNINSGEVKLP